MKPNKVLIALWVFLAICAFALPVIFREKITTFIGSVFVRNQQSGQIVNPAGVTFDTFLKGNNINTDLTGNNGLFYPVQGVIHGYDKTPDGVNYINLDYIIGNRVLNVKVLLTIPESAIPKYLSSTGEADAASKKQFRDSYVDNVSAITWGKTEKVPMNITDFEKGYPPTTLVKIYVLKTYPDKTLRTGDFCKIHGYFVCGVSDLADTYGGNLSDFWKGNGTTYQGYLIPLSFDTNINFK